MGVIILSLVTASIGLPLLLKGLQYLDRGHVASAYDHEYRTRRQIHELLSVARLRHHLEPGLLEHADDPFA